MRKISKNEIKHVSAIFAEIFEDYKLYDVLFKHDRFEQRKIYYFFCYEIFGSQKYTYVNDDFSAVASIKKPNDMDISTIGLFVNPFFFLAFCLWTGHKARKIAVEYMKFAAGIAKKYYNPQTDCYIKNIGVRKEYRGQGKLTAMINEVCGDMPIYLETHDSNNVEIYKKLGFILCEVKEWRGTMHYAMKRP